MFRLTDNQLLHRQYLESPVWKEKRQQALDHYGCICARCKNYGTDVHHKTYERWGGDELMEDLEVLCRECHEAHHRAEKVNKPKEKRLKGIHRQGIFPYLNSKQKQRLMTHFSISTLTDLSCKLAFGDNNQIVLLAAKMLGFDYFYGKIEEKDGKRKKRKPPRRPPQVPPDEQLKWISFEEFKNTDIPT